MFGDSLKLTAFDVFPDDNNLVGLLPNELQALDQLVNVSFYNNTMVSGSIPRSYGSLSNLKKFDISNNAIMGTIPTTICNSTSLHRINIKMNILAGTIPTCIGSLDSLRSLEMDRNLLTGTIPTHVGRLPSLGKNTTVETYQTTTWDNRADKYLFDLPN